MAVHQNGSGRVEPVRKRGLHPLAAGVQYPDIQYHFLPMAVRYDGKAAAEGHGYQAHVGPMRSASRGSVTLRSADPQDAPQHPVQLYVRPAGLGGFPHLHPPDPRDFRARGVQRLFEVTKSSPAPMCNPMTSWTLSSANTSRAPITPAAPARWAGPMIRWRWWTLRPRDRR